LEIHDFSSLFAPEVPREIADSLMSSTIETFGSTRLVEDASLYFLYPSGGSAVELMYGGAPVVAGQFGQWAPIGAEQTASGYQVVWKLTGADQYTVWNTDSIRSRQTGDDRLWAAASRHLRVGRAEGAWQSRCWVLDDAATLVGRHRILRCDWRH
jgi:hypothetical protein